MDKDYLPYLHNEKQFQVLPNGQYLYRYPKGDGVELVKASKELRRKLFELDKREYIIRKRKILSAIAYPPIHAVGIVFKTDTVI